jgi:hypothetical protein
MSTRKQTPETNAPKAHARSFPRLLQQHLLHVKDHLLRLDLEALACQSGFRQRLPRKIPIPSFALALVALAAETVLSLERIATVISVAAKTSYSKQALHERLGQPLQDFLAQIATALFDQVGLPVKNQGWFRSFQRVLLHDSTVLALPEHLAAVFPGASNGRKRRYASLKIQFVCDLLSAKALHLSLSGYTRNDQAAAPDILQLLRPGDLILRDLGYFVLHVLEQIQLLGAFFLSRYRHGVNVYDPQTLQPLDLAKLLRPGQGLDRQVLLGNEKLAVRLVARPVPEAVANRRRHQAKTQRDRRSSPSAQHLFLMSWNIFVTNVPRSLWPAQALQPIYRLRWRIEIIFKAWKSHLGLRQFNCRTAPLLSLSVLTKLLFCIIVYQLCNALELLGDHHQHVSLLRLARVLAHCACWFAATLLGLTLEQWLDIHLKHHAFYERRRDRKNFFELLAGVTCPLA